MGKQKVDEKKAGSGDIDNLDLEDLTAIYIEVKNILVDINDLKKVMLTKKDLQEFATDITGIFNTMVDETEAVLKKKRDKEVTEPEEPKMGCEAFDTFCSGRNINGNFREELLHAVMAAGSQESVTEEELSAYWHVILDKSLSVARMVEVSE